MVKFLNLVPWGGLYFCYKPNQVIDLPEVTAIAREKAGLGKIIVEKPVDPPKAVATKPAKAKAEAKAEPPKVA